jgi:hypothetical protein
VPQLNAVRRLGEWEDTASLLHARSMARGPTGGHADRAIPSCTIGLSISARVLQLWPA